MEVENKDIEIPNKRMSATSSFTNVIYIYIITKRRIHAQVPSLHALHCSGAVGFGKRLACLPRAFESLHIMTSHMLLR